MRRGTTINSFIFFLLIGLTHNARRGKAILIQMNWGFLWWRNQTLVLCVIFYSNRMKWIIVRFSPLFLLNSHSIGRKCPQLPKKQTCVFVLIVYYQHKYAICSLLGKDKHNEIATQKENEKFCTWPEICQSNNFPSRLVGRCFNIVRASFSL